MRQQQQHNCQIRDGAEDLESLYLTAPPIVSLSRSLLSVEAIISSPHVSLADLALPIFFPSRIVILKAGDVESRFWPCMAWRR